jgi:hypothetical protein
MIARHETKLLIVILLTFAILASGFSLGPIFEGPDEIEHYRYIRTLQNNLALPDPAGRERGQFHQAPLYYVLLLPIAALLPDDDFSRIDGRFNPYHGYAFERPGNDNKNLFIHTRAEDFPFTDSQTALAVHLLRLTSIGISIGTLAAAFGVFSILWSEHPDRRLLAVGIMAFWPQFIYLSSIINNDTLAIMLATTTLYLLLRYQATGLTWKRSAVLGSVLGAALLTKASLAALAVPVGFFFLMMLAKDRRVWRYAMLTLTITVVIAGWWYLRNWVLYGDPTGIRAMFQTWQTELLATDGPALDTGLHRARYAYQTLWARFGQGAVAVGGWIYRLFDLLVVLGATGLGIRMVRGLRRYVPRETLFRWALITLFLIVWVGNLIYGASIAISGNQGRYLLPGIAAMGALLAAGLDTWLRPLPGNLARIILPLYLAGLCLVALVGYFHPAYRPLPVPDHITHPLDLYFTSPDDDTQAVARITGSSLETTVVFPGEKREILIYWQALESNVPGLQSYLHSAFVEDVVWRDSLPGNGHRPSDDWRARETWAERYQLTIPSHAVPGTIYYLVAGLYHPITDTILSARTADGEIIGPAPIIAVLQVSDAP